MNQLIEHRQVSADQVKALRLQKKKTVMEATGLLQRATTEGRPMTSEENQQYERMFADINAYSATIEKAEALAELDYAITEKRSETKERTGISVEEQNEAFLAWVRGGMADMSQEQRSLLKPADITKEMRALTTQTGSTGGVTIPQGFESNIVMAMKFWNGVESAGAEVMTTDSGNDIPWPNFNDTTNVAVIVGENTAVATNTDPAFNSITMKAYNYTSNMLLVPNQLLQDTGINLEAVLAEAFAQRFGRGFGAHCTTGDNSSKPQGVVPASTVGKTGANGQTTSVTYNDLVDLKFSVDRAYRTPRARWMMNDQTLKAIVKLVDSQGRPLALDYQPGIKQGDPDVLLGYPMVINNDMAVMAANARSILFGDFFNYKIRRVRGMQSIRVTERYVELYQTGFVAFMRQDARLQDAGTNPIKCYVNSAT